MTWIIDSAGTAINTRHVVMAWRPVAEPLRIGVRMIACGEPLAMLFNSAARREAAFKAITANEEASQWIVGASTDKTGSPDGSETYGWAYAIASDARPIPIWKAFRLRSRNRDNYGQLVAGASEWRFLVEGANPAMRDHVILRGFDDHDAAVAFVREFVPNFPNIPEVR